MTLSRGSLLYLSRCIHALETQSLGSRRAFHGARHLLAKAAPRPSPRVRAAQRNNRPEPVQETLPRPKPTEHGAPRLYDPKVLSQAIEKRIFSEKDSMNVILFMKEWEEQMFEHPRDGPWVEAICQKYDISHETLYTLGTYPRIEERHVTQAMANSMDILIGVAARRGSRLATLYQGAGLFQLPGRPQKALPVTEPILVQLEEFAREGDRQSMTMLAILELQRKNHEKAQGLLENALQWPPQPYSPRRSLHTTKELSSSQRQEYYGATRDQINDMVQKVVSNSKVIDFPGANEATRMLGSIYKAQINTSYIRTPASTNYYLQAAAAFTFAARHLEDAASTSYILEMLPDDHPDRSPLILMAAMHGQPRAWRELSKSVEGQANVQPRKEMPSSKEVDDKNSTVPGGHVINLMHKEDGQSLQRSQSRSTPGLSVSEKMGLEWGMLTSYHDEMGVKA